MAKMCLKKASKRMTCRKRYKIERKVREHNRKVKKENKNKKHKTSNKPISVPNKCPFKEEVLMQAERAREQIEEQKRVQKELAKERRAEKRKLECDNLDELQQKIARSTEEFEQKLSQQSSEVAPSDQLNDKSVKAYASEVRKLVESADIIIEVLDARDPLGSRSKSIEESVLKSGKRLVLLLNKIDLIPKANVKEWLSYLRRQFPTIAFKASTQEQSQKLGRYSYANLNADTSKCIGANLVMSLLANYCRNKDIKTSVRVGVIGYPNVGKSSVINSLKRMRACEVGATPGLTKQLQEIELDKHIRLIDSPGVVLEAKDKLDTVEIALKNAVRIEALEDPVAPVQAILRRCSVETLMKHYKMPEFRECDQFLALVARKMGKLSKGGRPNMNAAAKQVLIDWNSGKLRYYTTPPETAGADDVSCPVELVSQFSKEFDLDVLDGELSALVEGLDEAMDVQPIAYDVSKSLDNDEEAMETENDKFVVTGSKEKSRDKTQSAEVDMMPKSLEIDGNVQINRAVKKVVKKNKKRQAKIAKKADAALDELDMDVMNVDSNQDYDFAVLDN
ncbi:hypothetical protein QR680_016349 [Steinernema hermaphroditum]|uniref:Guanine nucleotide-binding protein-like 3 homolog n=1 Tax=Steinernema hermaphroditum TaxID=289476 RepID=A0AA39LM77_9BILA|nr:hypothetical protein QR680_016349 [Steinernema hermaphroditum]